MLETFFGSDPNRDANIHGVLLALKTLRTVAFRPGPPPWSASLTVRRGKGLNAMGLGVYPWRAENRPEPARVQPNPSRRRRRLPPRGGGLQKLCFSPPLTQITPKSLILFIKSVDLSLPIFLEVFSTRSSDYFGFKTCILAALIHTC